MSPGPAAPGSPAEETLAPEVLAELRTIGGETLVAELMAVFVEHTPERLRSAEQSFAAGELEQTAAALHSLRSAAGTVGARRLAGLAGRLEQAARGGGSELGTGLEDLRREIDAALSAARRLARA